MLYIVLPGKPTYIICGWNSKINITPNIYLIILHDQKSGNNKSNIFTSKGEQFCVFLALHHNSYKRCWWFWLWTRKCCPLKYIFCCKMNSCSTFPILIKLTDTGWIISYALLKMQGWLWVACTVFVLWGKGWRRIYWTVCQVWNSCTYFYVWKVDIDSDWFTIINLHKCDNLMLWKS